MRSRKRNKRKQIKEAARADDLLVEQDEVSGKKKNDKISTPQNKKAENVKPPETYDSWTDAYCKMIKKQEEENKRKEELRQIREMNAELEKNPVWQELMNWDYK